MKAGLFFFRNPSNWKLLLTGFVGGFILYTVLLDFTDPLVQNWNIFREEEKPTTTQSYGAKAAMLAMAGAATLFTSLIPIGTSPRSRRIDLGVQIVGAIAVTSTGWYWLLNATDGNPGPYLAAIVPSMAVFVLAFGAFLGLRIAGELDQKRIEESGKATLTWDVAILGLAIAVAYALIVGIVFYLPGWLF